MGRCCSKEYQQQNEQESNIGYPKLQEQHIQDKFDKIIKQESDYEDSSKSTTPDKNIEEDEEQMSPTKLRQKQQKKMYDDIQKENQKIQPDRFQKLVVLGRGGFGKVFLVEHKETEKLYAMKCVQKDSILDGQQQYQAQEKFILSLIKNPYIVDLDYAFQTSDQLYLILEFCQGGEIVKYLNKINGHNEQNTIFYVAQLVLVLECLHKRGVIYRDLKPNNVLLHEDGSLRLTDFGLCKILKGKQSTYTKCGTKLYIAPEVFQGLGYNCTADYFNLGLVAYEILTGKPVFHELQEVQRVRSILDEEEPSFPAECSLQIQDLIQQLLKPCPEERLGYNGIQQIKDHPVFININWEDLANKKVQPPIKLNFKNRLDVQYFQKKYTDLAINDEGENLKKSNNRSQIIYKKQ